MKNIFIINGKPGSGKDTFVELCKEHCRKFSIVCKDTKSDVHMPIVFTVHNISSIDIVKDIAKGFGWNGEKDPISRNMLADLKKFLTTYFNVVDKYIEDKIEEVSNDSDSIIFIHIREPEEIQKLKDKYPNAKTIFIDRKVDMDSNITNSSDLEVENYKYNYTINNDGTLNDLKQKVYVLLLNIIIDNYLRPEGLEPEDASIYVLPREEKNDPIRVKFEE
jgi:guanylate kinase